jgi:hypothetical protein
MSKNLIILINNFGVIIRKECTLEKIPENSLNANIFLSKKIRGLHICHYKLKHV